MAKQTGLPHLLLSIEPLSRGYTSKQTFPGKVKRARIVDKNGHGIRLQKELGDAYRKIIGDKSKSAAYTSDLKGYYIVFKSFAGFPLISKSLESISKNIRLLRVYTDQGEVKRNCALIYIPYEERNLFINKIKQYLSHSRTDSGNRHNEPLIESIENILAATIETFWSDDPTLLPIRGFKIWCEVWIITDENKVSEGAFIKYCTDNGITFEQAFFLRFDERSIFLVKLDSLDIEAMILNFDHLAEIRVAKELTSFWSSLGNEDQASAVEELRTRTTLEISDVVACILDTGVNPDHPLLCNLIAENSLHVVEPEWGLRSESGHGTEMAGVAAYGDLTALLSSTLEHKQVHGIESVKILTRPNYITRKAAVLDEQKRGELWGSYIVQGIARIEVAHPKKRRVFCLAVTAKGSRDMGRPTSWSAAIDKMAYGASEATDEKEASRLIFVSAGNRAFIDETTGLSSHSTYPTGCYGDLIHDPAQAYNAVVVGAYTEKYIIEDEFAKLARDYASVASPGGISPFTTSSIKWEQNRWPIKPDIVLEGGNIARHKTDVEDFHPFPSLNVLTTSSDFQEEGAFAIGVGTSMAVAQATNMAAIIASKYPYFTPETIRGLMIHCAEWTDEMKRQMHPLNSRADFDRLLRICGYGVPTLERCLNSASNVLTMIVQSSIQPFKIVGRTATNRGKVATNEMHYYTLPWPKAALLAVRDVKVTLRITLSYFAEPYPGELGNKDRYRYCSHGLRFDLIDPIKEHSMEAFNKRLNKQAATEDEVDQLDSEAANGSSSDRWVIGINSIKRGTVQSNWLIETTGEELAQANIIGIYPVIGWWRELEKRKKVERPVDYCLIVSLVTDDESVDIYTPVAQAIAPVIITEV